MGACLMPKYIVETNFFVEASDEDGARAKVEQWLAHLPGWTVAWVAPDEFAEGSLKAHCPCGDPADCTEVHA